MRVLLRAVLVFSVLGLTAASGRTNDDDPVGEEQPLPSRSGNKVAFATNSPSSPNPGEVTAGGTVTTGKDWKCTNLLIEVITIGNKVQSTYGLPAPGANWGPVTVTKLLPDTYRVRLTGDFEHTKSGQKEQVQASSTTFSVK